MTQIAVLAKLTAAEGKRDDLQAAMAELLANAEGESGTLVYQLFADKGDANVLWMWELYADQAALDAHGSSDGFKAAGKALAPFLGGRPELFFLDPAGGKGLPG
jgi:quinol monooxygenase YgiN